MDTGTKKTVLQNTAIVLIVVLLVASFYYLFLALTIRKTITGFKQACAGYEVTEAIEYIDPVEARIPILVSAGVLETYQMITGDEQMAQKVLTAVFNVLLGTDLKTEDLGEFVRSLRYNRVFLIPGWKSCGVSCYLHYKVNGQNLKKKIRIRFVNRDGKWYIYSIKA